MKADGEVTVEERREPRDFSSERSDGYDSLAVRFKFFCSRTMCGHISAVYVSISLMQFGIRISILSFLIPIFSFAFFCSKQRPEREEGSTHFETVTVGRRESAASAEDGGEREGERSLRLLMEVFRSCLSLACLKVEAPAGTH